MIVTIYGTEIKIENEKSSIKLKVINQRMGEIEKLEVPFEKQRNGIGTLLLHKLERIARNKGLRKLSLLCRTDNKPALNLYIKEDYQIEGLLKNHFENGIDIYILSKFI